MATKRPISDVHPSRREQVPGEPRRKKQKPEHINGKSFKKAHTVSDLKSSIRSLKRLLEHNDDLPANVRVDKERALQTAQHELAEAERAKKRSEVIGRWHKVRFFERQKAERRLKKLRRKLEAGGDGVELKRRVQDGEVDVNYALYYPLEREYVPLFAKQKREEGESASPEPGSERKGDPEMWEMVKKCMKEGTLDALRNGKLEGDETVDLKQDSGSKLVASTAKKRRKNEVEVQIEGNRRERRRAAAAAKAAASDEDSDGGFFEK